MVKHLPLQMLTWAVTATGLLAGKVAAPIMVAIGMNTGWPKVCWPWDNFSNNGKYADPHWYQQTHWSWQVSPRFAEWWWRAVRNGFSNGARYALKNTAKKDLWQHPQYHKGWYKGPASRAFPHRKRPYPKTLFRYEYDAQRPWLARYVFTWFATQDKYFQFYVGFKFDRTEGFGFSLRCWYYNNEK